MPSSGRRNSRETDTARTHTTNTDHEEQVKKKTKKANVVAAALFFMACSAGMMISNKALLNRIDLPLTLVLAQMAFTAAALAVNSRLMHFGKRKHVLRWARSVPLLFTAMLVSSMIALEYASMGAIVVVRNLAPMVSILIEGPINGEMIENDKWTFSSLILIIAGVALYVRNDVAFSPFGMLCMLFNMVVGVAERLMQRKLLAVEPIDVNKPGLMFINNAVSLLPMCIVLSLSHEIQRWQKELGRLTLGDYGLLFLSCINGVAISWAGINVQSYVSATTFTVLANLNKFVVVAFGMLVLNEASSVQSVVGCSFALLGGFAYVHARQRLAKSVRAPIIPTSDEAPPR